MMEFDSDCVCFLADFNSGEQWTELRSVYFIKAAYDLIRNIYE